MYALHSAAVSATAKPVKRQGKHRPWDGQPGVFGSCSSGDGDRTNPSPGGGLGGESFVPFLFCSTTDSPASGTQNLKKEQFPFSPGLKWVRMAVHDTQPRQPRPPLLLPVGSRVRSEDAIPSPALPTQPFSQVRVIPRTQTPLRDALPSDSGPCVPLRCPTAGTSVVPLVPLVRSLGAWLELPRPSCWLTRTIWPGYAIQFARHPPKFRGIRYNSVLNKDAPVLSAEIVVLLVKDAIEPVLSAEMKTGLYSPYFNIPKKCSGLCPISDLCGVKRVLHNLLFRMLTQKRICPLDWFTAIDLKDGYFHISILPGHRPFLHFAFEKASISVQGPSLRAVPVTSCLHQSHGGSSGSFEGKRHSRSQLPQQLAHTGPVRIRSEWALLPGMFTHMRDVFLWQKQPHCNRMTVT